MRCVYKYIVPVDHESNVMMPREAKILSAGFQGDDLMIWALVEPDYMMVPRKIRVVGTGFPNNDGICGRPFIGTVFKPESGLVFHLFDYGEK